MAPTVSSLHIYPVKSCRGIDVTEAVVGPYGFAGDREWQVVGDDGAMLTQRPHPELARVVATPFEGGIRVSADGYGEIEIARPAAADRTAQTFSGDVPVADAGDEAAAWFEGVLGRPCRLVAMASGYARRLPEAIDPFGQEVSLSDLAPVLVAAASSHRFLEERADEPFGIDRFRPNVVVAGSEPWDEDTWREIAIGGASLRAALPWPRCTIPQVDQLAGTRHREPAVVLKEYRWLYEAPGLSPALQSMLCGNPLFGVACSAGPEGAVIAVGDAVEVLERGDALLPPPVTPGRPAAS